MVASAATRRGRVAERPAVALAAALTLAALFGGTPGWYAYLAGVLTWVFAIAVRLVLTARAHGQPATSGRAGEQ